MPVDRDQVQAALADDVRAQAHRALAQVRVRVGLLHDREEQALAAFGQILAVAKPMRCGCRRS